MRGICCWVALGLLVACGDDDVATDAGVDAPVPDDASADVPSDAYVRPAPTCPEPATLTPPACGTGSTRLGVWSEDATLDAKALAYDRGFHALFAWPTGVNAEARVADDEARAAVEQFFAAADAWDFEAATGRSVDEVVLSWAKVAGAYAGAGVAADAFRYAVLRDEGAACEEIERARMHLHRDLDALHRAVAITGAPGVIARGFHRADLPGGAHETTPLFDGEGAPLPAEKTNGTWRDDQSGDYPGYVWEDSCSRDMLIGWVLGMAAVWEVARGDDTIDAIRLATLSDDADAIARNLMQVGESGRDLEIHDADGRLTFHAYLHESAVDRMYVDRFRGNGQHAAMALGIAAALARIGDDPEVDRWLHESLVVARDLPGIVRDHVGIIDFGPMTNFSNHNMTWTGLWLASRYLCDDEAREAVREGTMVELYAREGSSRRVDTMGQSFFDLVYVAARSRGTADRDLDAASIDDDALERGLTTLNEFPSAPYWAVGRMNCDEAEIASGVCVAKTGPSFRWIRRPAVATRSSRRFPCRCAFVRRATTSGGAIPTASTATETRTRSIRAWTFDSPIGWVATSARAERS
ncbi:MAG: hypothetical protein H6722_34135 [Sandaracinus sp.]|nr:hypothetical protein [Myxococcales bacterium]MCB9603963.1 hypothetical protein [Sandaracinus sp.]MCB9617501.1 hypothetical protein [Sandaracinus sp.]MCB9620291.1 hypothetical protein [Sandaracinus sp.]